MPISEQNLLDVPQYQQELDVACLAVQHCAVLTKELQKATLSQESKISKSDFSPVTIGDFASQALLTSACHGAFKDDKFLAEESADDLRQNGILLNKVWELVESVKPAFAASTPSLATPKSKEELLDLIDSGGKTEHSNGDRTWVYDPIDGTATFLKGQQYAINCALLVNGREEIGIIGCPNVIVASSTIKEAEIDQDGPGVMIVAVRGYGAFTRPMRSDGKLATAVRIPRHGDEMATLSQKTPGMTWCDCSEYTSTILELHRAMAERLHTSWPGVDLFSSLMKYAALGLGRANIVIRIFKYGSWRSNMWDHAGGVLIFQEVGGKVTDLNGKDIDFTQGRKMAANYGLVCAPRHVHAEILEIVQRLLAEHGPIPWSK